MKLVDSAVLKEKIFWLRFQRCYINKFGKDEILMGKVRFNEDREVVAMVKEGLKRTGGYCPCRLERKPEYKCICDEFKEQIKDPNFEGYCHCRLYYKEK